MNALAVKDAVQLVMISVLVHVIILVVRLVTLYVVMGVRVPVLNYVRMVVGILLHNGEINELR